MVNRYTIKKITEDVVRYNGTSYSIVYGEKSVGNVKTMVKLGVDFSTEIDFSSKYVALGQHFEELPANFLPFGKISEKLWQKKLKES